MKIWLLPHGSEGLGILVWWCSDKGGMQGNGMKVVWSYYIGESGGGRIVYDRIFGSNSAGITRGCAYVSMVKHYTRWFCTDYIFWVRYVIVVICWSIPPALSSSRSTCSLYHREAQDLDIQSALAHTQRISHASLGNCTDVNTPRIKNCAM